MDWIAWVFITENYGIAESGIDPDKFFSSS